MTTHRRSSSSIPPWFRLYHEIADDPKLARLSEINRWRYILVLCLNHRRLVPCDDADAAHVMRITRKEAAEARAQLQKAGLVTLPPDFALTAELREYAIAKLPGVDPDELFATFTGHAIAKAWKYASWPRAFQEYIRNAQPTSGHWAAGQYPRNGAAQADKGKWI